MGTELDELTEPDPELPGVVDAGPAREAPPEPVNRSWIGSLAWYVVLIALSLAGAAARSGSP